MRGTVPARRLQRLDEEIVDGKIFRFTADRVGDRGAHLGEALQQLQPLHRGAHQGEALHRYSRYIVVPTWARRDGRQASRVTASDGWGTAGTMCNGGHLDEADAGAAHDVT